MFTNEELEPKQTEPELKATDGLSYTVTLTESATVQLEPLVALSFIHSFPALLKVTVGILSD